MWKKRSMQYELYMGYCQTQPLDTADFITAVLYSYPKRSNVKRSGPLAVTAGPAILAFLSIVAESTDS